MRIVKLEQNMIVNGRYRVKGEVISVPDTFGKKYVKDKLVDSLVTEIKPVPKEDIIKKHEAKQDKLSDTI